MRSILLNGIHHKLAPGTEIIQRAINPWKAQVRQTGGKEYSDFSQAELEEYFDFRNGIGKNRGLGSDARLEFSEGIDFSAEGQAVLGPLVTTAGSFGVAPIKIIGFQSGIYAIGDNAIGKWRDEITPWWDINDPYLIHTCEAAWDELVDGDATVTLDTVIEKQGSGCAKMVVGAGLASGDIIATDDITAIDLTNAEKVRLWVRCTETRASGDLQLLLDDTAQCASPVETINIPALVANTWTLCTLTLANPTSDTAIISVGIKFTTNAEACTIYVDHIMGTFPDPIDAIVVTDSTDEYLIVSSATTAVSTVDGTTWVRFYGSFLDFREVDANSKLTVTGTKATAADADTDEDVYLYADKGAKYFNALDIDFELYIASTSEDNGMGGIAITNTVGDFNDFAATDISVIAERDIAAYKIFLYRGDKVANDSYTGSADTLYYCTLTRAASNDTCTVTIYSDAGRTNLLDTLSVAGFSTTEYRYIYGFVNRNDATGGENFDGYVQNLEFGEPRGYLAEYENRLYCITTDGKLVLYSVAKNIDAYGGRFDLTGNFGTVYDLFEGKLLADGTNTVYFCGTEGLFTIDTTNELAYKQEVAYPPLTNAGNVGLYWNANVWVATGYGILKVAPSTATFVGPDQDDGLPATYQGKVYDFATVNNWLVFCVNGGTTDKSSILKRNSSLGGNLQVYTTASVNKPIACIHHSPASKPTISKLWFGEGTDIKYMMFPDTTSNVKQISTYEYVNDSGYGTFPIFRKLAAISKTALGVAAITKSCDANEYIEVFYGLNGAVATTSLGTFVTSPRPTILTFASGLGTVFYTIQLAVKLYRGATITNSPELESLIFYYIPTPATISGFICRIQATEDDAEAEIADFETIRDTNTLVAFYPSGDATKTKYNVKLTTMPLRFYHEEMKEREGFIEISLEQIFEG